LRLVIQTSVITAIGSAPMIEADALLPSTWR